MPKLKPFQQFGEYRTKSGRFYFSWLFERRNDGAIRTIIIHAPGWSDKSTDQRFQDWLRTRDYNGGADTQYPAFTFIEHEPMPRTFDEAVKSATQWAEAVEDYVSASSDFFNP